MTIGTLCQNSFYGGVEYQNARYLRAYQVDLNTPSEVINTYQVDDHGAVVGKSKARVSQGYSTEDVNQGGGVLDGTFYSRKITKHATIQLCKTDCSRI